MTEERIREVIAIMEQLDLHVQEYIMAILRSLKFAQDTIKPKTITLPLDLT